MNYSSIPDLIRVCEDSAMYAWSQGREVCPEFAQAVYLCPTNLCNHRCVTCGYMHMRRGRRPDGSPERGFMPWDVFERIVEQLPEEGRRVYFQKTGESLLHPRIADMLRHFRGRRPAYEIAMHTNATRLTPDNQEALLRFADFVSLSIFGFDRGSYKAAHRRDTFDLAMANISEFHRRYETGGRRPKVYFDVVRCAPNRHLTDLQIFDFLSSRFPLFNVGIHFPYNFQNTVPGYEMRIEGKLDMDRFPVCIVPYVILIILWDGRVGYCMGDPFERASLGNAREQTLAEIWNDDRYRTFRRSHHEHAWARLRERHILCAECNWPFALKSMSAENLCLVHARALPDALDGLPNHMPVTGRDNLMVGLRQYLRGEVTNALKSLTMAEIASRDPDERSLAKTWKEKTVDVLRMRENIEHWEDALRRLGLSLSTVHVSQYHISEAQKAAVGVKHVAGGGAVYKKADL